MATIEVEEWPVCPNCGLRTPKSMGYCRFCKIELDIPAGFCPYCRQKYNSGDILGQDSAD